MRIGTVGTGFITNYILDNIEKTDGISCHAVYSRNEVSARRLAEKYHIEKTYTDYERMLSDDSLDFIYIASPNSLHYSQTKSALEHGKNVICEKPFTVTAAEAVELIRLAKENHLFLFEAITTLHQPGFHWVRKNISLLGSIKMISLTFCQYSSGMTPSFPASFQLFLIRNLPVERFGISTCIIFIFWLVCLENQTVSNISPGHMKTALIHMVFLFSSLVILSANAVVPKTPPVKITFRSWAKKDISMSVLEAVIVKTADLYSVIQNVLFARKKLHGITKSRN